MKSIIWNFVTGIGQCEPKLVHEFAEENTTYDCRMMENFVFLGKVFVKF